MKSYGRVIKEQKHPQPFEEQRSYLIYVLLHNTEVTTESTFWDKECLGKSNYECEN